MLRMITDVFKLRIGFAIMFCAVAGYAVTPGASHIALAGAGDGPGCLPFLRQRRRLQPVCRARTRRADEADPEPAVRHRSPARRAGCGSPASVRSYWSRLARPRFVLNAYVALYVFLGAFVYGVVYTVWLKQRSAWNIVIGGLAGSFAVLAGAAAIDPAAAFAAEPAILAVVLFLWTPPHFWSLATALHEDYKRAGFPCFPSLSAMPRRPKIILAHTIALGRGLAAALRLRPWLDLSRGCRRGRSACSSSAASSWCATRGRSGRWPISMPRSSNWDCCCLAAIVDGSVNL